MTDETALTAEEMRRVHERDNFVKQRLADRVATLTLENLELMGIIRELQDDLLLLRSSPDEVSPQE